MLPGLDIPGVAGDIDAPALAAAVGLADVCAVSPLAAKRLEFPIAVQGRPRSGFRNHWGLFPVPCPWGAGSLILTSSCLHSLSGEAPGAWEDVILGGEQFLHAVQVPGQQVFAADLRHAWEVVDFLQ